MINDLTRPYTDVYMYCYIICILQLFCYNIFSILTNYLYKNAKTTPKRIKRQTIYQMNKLVVVLCSIKQQLKRKKSLFMNLNVYFQ